MYSNGAILCQIEATLTRGRDLVSQNVVWLKHCRAVPTAVFLCTQSGRNGHRHFFES